MTSAQKIFVPIAIVIVAILAVAGFIVMKGKGSSGEAVTWKTYNEEDIGFQVAYPSDWTIQDSLTKTSCCLFIAHIVNSTTTEPNASGTPMQKITSREFIKIQIGGYDKKINDPFKAATTSKVTLGGTEFYTGMSGAMQFYLLPKTESQGVGAAIFPYVETPEADKETAKKIVASIKLTATSTPSAATTTKAK